MISTGTWKSNGKIPTIGTIADNLSVSTPVVRGALKKLEYEKTIINYGSLGFFVLSDALIRRHKLSRTSMLLHMASVNLDAAKAQHIKSKLFGQYGIGYNPKTKVIQAHNVITHKSLTTTADELDEIIISPVTFQLMLESPDDKLSRLKRKYKRQQMLLRLARVVNLNKAELGILND